MTITDTFPYYECSRLNAKFLQLDYTGGDISMTIVLPNERSGLAALEARLPEVFEDRNFTYERVNVKLPKFTIESTIQFKPILQNVSFRWFLLLDMYVSEKFTVSCHSTDNKP